MSSAIRRSASERSRSGACAWALAEKKAAARAAARRMCPRLGAKREFRSGGGGDELVAEHVAHGVDEVRSRAVQRHDHVGIERLQLRHGALQVIVGRREEMEA